MEKKRKPYGIVPAIITPITAEGMVDINLLERQTEYLVNAGADGLFVCGGTGEGAYLKTEEKEIVYRTIREIVGEKVFLCMALLQSNTRAVLEEMDCMNKYRPDFIVVTPPYYHSASQSDIYEHYRILSEHTCIPILVYNIPSTTHNYIEPTTVRRLSELDNIAGIKDSSGNFMDFTRGLFERHNEQFAWFQGEDYLCGASLLAGGDGIVSGLSNVRVEPYIEMYRAYRRNDSEKVKECQNQINTLYKLIHLYGNGNAAIKAATEIYGRGSRWMQQKSMSLTDEQMKSVKKILHEYEKQVSN